MPAAKLIIADSEKNANLYYATRFLAPDPFIFAQINGRRFMVMSDLELDRARAQAKVDEVLSYAKLSAALKKDRAAARPGTGRAGEPTMVDVVVALLKDHQVAAVEVPGDFGLAYADGLRKRGIEVAPKPEPFFPERMVKSEEEIAFLIKSLRTTEEAVEMAT